MSDPIRILLVDDHAIVHRAMAALVATFPDLEVVGHAKNGQEAIDLCGEVKPDVVVMDVIMPGMNGIEATRILHERYPEVKVLALSSFQDEATVREMLKAGASGYILKETFNDDVAATIRGVYEGKAIFSQEVAQTLFHSEVPPPGPGKDYGLTAREREILHLLIEGKNNGEIAAALTISISTAKFHVRSIFAKLGVTNRVEAVALAVEEKLLP
ncbi:MAG TPA: response regulator transcription factor [Aggregatilineales bacterium]|nr:response regulator transcription factor [Aggregatilineales bacterium]